MCFVSDVSWTAQAVLSGLCGFGSAGRLEWLGPCPLSDGGGEGGETRGGEEPWNDQLHIGSWGVRLKDMNEEQQGTARTGEEYR